MGKEKNPEASKTITTQVVCPNDTNPMGILQGGVLVQWMDLTAAICAQRHADKICLTLSIENLRFLAPANLGDIITVEAKVTRTFRTSMEVSVKVWGKKVGSMNKTLINKAYFTFVAIDSKMKSALIAPIKPLSPEEKMDFKAAGNRKTSRKDD